MFETFMFSSARKVGNSDVLNERQTPGHEPTVLSLLTQHTVVAPLLLNLETKLKYISRFSSRQTEKQNQQESQHSLKNSYKFVRSYAVIFQFRKARS